MAHEVTEHDLEDMFGKYGKLSRCALKKGFAFVTFETREDADEATRQLQGKDLFGSNLYIEAAKERGAGKAIHPAYKSLSNIAALFLAVLVEQIARGASAAINLVTGLVIVPMLEEVEEEVATLLDGMSSSLPSSPSCLTFLK